MRFVLALVLLAGCAGVNAPPVNDAMAGRAQSGFPGITVAELGRGRDLYLGRCGGCHTLVAPEAHSDAEWPGLVGEMKERAKLEDDEQRLVTAYLIAASP
jgi:mono/diheme cytochrome c family protein